MRNLLWIIIAVFILGGGYWWYMSSQSMMNTPSTVNENAASPAPVATLSDTSATTPTAALSTVTVTYDGKTFSPTDVTIKAGDTVNFKNSSGKNMWVASDEHPTHTVYDGTSRSTHCAADYSGEKPFDQCKPESTDYSFTFAKVGKIEFHDHINPSAHGFVTVQ